MNKDECKPDRYDPDGGDGWKAHQRNRVGREDFITLLAGHSEGRVGSRETMHDSSTLEEQNSNIDTCSFKLLI